MIVMSKLKQQGMLYIENIYYIQSFFNNLIKII